MTEKGFGKRTEMTDYLRQAENGERQPQSRGGKGLKSYAVSEKTGKVVGVLAVRGDEDILMIANGGVMIRMPVEDINVYRRDTQGVKVMRLAEGNRVISIERVEHQEAEADQAADQTPEQAAQQTPEQTEE